MSIQNNTLPDNPNIEVIKAKQTGLFTNYIYKAIPLAFDESMSYYETLCGLLNYLKNTILPTLNNNADAVSELQNLYIELKTYVDDYFTDLDVQEEINNKLDEMTQDGTFANLINNGLLKDINNKVVQNSENIGTLNDQLQNTVKTTDTNIITNSMLSQEVRESITGGATAVVGNNSVGTDNIQNDAITIYKLDNLLNENFNKLYHGIELPWNYIGARYYINNQFTITDSAQYCYSLIPLEKDKTYYFSGFNLYSIQGIVITDSNNNVIYTSPITDKTKIIEQVNILFKPNQTGLQAYLNQWTTPDQGVRPQGTKQSVVFSYLENIILNIKESDINPIKTVNGFMVDYLTSTSGINEPDFKVYESTNVDIYKLSKGVKYKIKGCNKFNICGLVLTNENLQVSYRSSTESVSPLQNFEYEFTASNNGYAFITTGKVGTDTLTGSIEIVKQSTKYNTYKWALIGDSLTDGNVNTNIKKYYSYIQEDLGINIQNLGQSGCGYKRKFNNGNNFVEQSMLIDNDVDIVSIFGSFNDGHEFGNMGTVNDKTTDTLLGCVYVTLNNIITNRPNAKIFVILPTPWGSNGSNPQTINYNNNIYIEGIKTIAKSLSIPVLDLFYDSNMYPWNENFKTTYYVNGDGTHPNTQGNKRFAYQIEEFIKKLI